MAIDTSDPAIQSAWADLTTDDSKNNWMLMKLDGKVVTCCGTGENCLEGVRANLSADDVMWGVIRVEALDVKKNVTSKRVKFIFLTWIGDNVPVLKKAKVSLQSQDVRKLFQGVAVFVDVSDPSDLDINELSRALLKIGGAHKPTKFVYGTEEFEVSGADKAN
eukprot:TRINITY_DN2037_c0_g1_i1.p1 TRINITY_DN2037_c0_g1~~TRINITY_DN2037_c0_g1_i1.p1  ORF type:complete len:163 (-),score=59.67 TRINITY_DN2037_c0_g1_i1:71-559(-)